MENRIKVYPQHLAQSPSATLHLAVSADCVDPKFIPGHLPYIHAQWFCHIIQTETSYIK